LKVCLHPARALNNAPQKKRGRSLIQKRIRPTRYGLAANSHGNGYNPVARSEVRVRSDRSGESDKDYSQANFIPQSLAEWHRGALGGKLQKSLLDHMVALNERHLKRLLSEYVRYHPEDRTHLGLEKGTPNGRIRSVASGRVLAQERVGGLHHRYNRAA
jgi:hypothetical protein